MDTAFSAKSMFSPPGAEVLVFESFFDAMINTKRFSWVKILIMKPEHQEGLIWTAIGEHLKTTNFILK